MIPEPFTRGRVGADALVQGCYLIRRDQQSRVPLPVRIWYGAPMCPDCGKELDRSFRWQCVVAGILLDDEPIRVGTTLYTNLSDFWPACAKNPITSSEYAYRLELARWEGENDDNGAYGDTRATIDPWSTSLPGFAQ